MSNSKSFLRIKPSDATNHDVTSYYVVVALDLLLLLASAAFSYSYFKLFFDMTRLPDEWGTALAIMLTAAQSIAIGWLLDSLMYAYTRRTWASKHSSLALLCAALIVYDLYANFQGIPALSENSVRMAEFKAPAYPAQAEYDRVKGEADAIGARNTYKGNTWIAGPDKATYKALQKQVAFHEGEMARLSETAAASYAEGQEKTKSRLAAMQSGLTWFNAAAYLLIFILLKAKHKLEQDAEENQGATIPALPSQPAMAPVARQQRTRPQAAPIVTGIGYNTNQNQAQSGINPINPGNMGVNQTGIDPINRQRTVLIKAIRDTRNLLSTSQRRLSLGEGNPKTHQESIRHYTSEIAEYERQLAALEQTPVN